MRSPIRRRLRRYAITTVIAVAPIAMLCAYVSNLLVPTSPLPRPASYDIVNTAGIEQSSSTIGIADSQMYWDSPEDVNRALDEMQALGVQSVRIAIPWAGIEQQQGNYNWSQVDLMVNAAAARGMGVLGVINHTPGWAGEYLNGHPDPATYAQFVNTVADKYGDKISAVEIWNEPNWVLSYNPVSPEAYTEMLKATYALVKPTHPNLTIIGGVLGAGISIGDWTMDPVTFLRRMYEAGAAGSFDALSFHPYQYTTKFSEGGPYPTSPLNQLEAMRDLMEQYNDATFADGTIKRVWISEYGVPTGSYPDGTVFTEEHQAEFIKDFLNTWQTISYAGPAFVYTTRDWETGSTNPDWNFGLFNTDWTKKLAADVVKKIIADLNQGPGPGPGPGPTDPFAEFARQLAAAFAALAAQLDAWFKSLTQPVVVATAAPTPLAATASVEESAVTLAATDTVEAADQTASKRSAVDATETEALGVEAEITGPEAVESEEAVAAVEEETTEVPAEPVDDVASEPVVPNTEEETSGTEEAAAGTENAATDESKTTDESNAATPASRKESDDESKGESKKDSDKRPDAAGRADPATSGGKHEVGNVKNGTSVNEVKDRLAKESVGADASSSTGSEAAA